MERLKERELLPGFRLKSVDGTLIGPQDYRERKNLVLVFFDIDCEPCGRFLEDAMHRYDDYLEQNAEILVIGNAPESDLRDLVKGLRLPFPVLSDPEGVVLDEYSNGVPTVIVTDRYGEIKMVERMDNGKMLPNQDKILSQLDLIEMQCDECGVSTWPV